MAIYTTLFLCGSRELQLGFPGWRLPLAAPVSRIRVNPFTQEQMNVETREPEWDDVDPNEMQLPGVSVVAVEGDYDTYLRSRIPLFVQSQHHWCAKDLTSVELEPLMAASLGEERGLEMALYAHPALGAGIERLPDDFLARLKFADESALNAIAASWATAMSTPEFTHTVNGRRIQDDMTIEEAWRVVGPIAELAKKQESGQSMYLLTEA